MKNILMIALLAFYVQVKVPAGMSRTYDNVQYVDIWSDGFTWRLTLADGKIVYVPALFTIIEEK